MYYFVYILENTEDKTWYIGFTQNLKQRIQDHIHKKSPYTSKKTGKWILIYCELYRNKKDALGREKFLKSGAGKNFIKKQIKNYLNIDICK